MACPWMPGLIRRTTIAGLIVASVALGGCGSLRLHSDVRQKQGEDAAKAWKDVDLKAFFAAERTNQAKLLDTEIASWRTHVLGPTYENTLTELSAKPVSAYRGLYETSIRKLVLGGSGSIGATDLANVNRETANAWSGLVKAQSADRTYELESSYLISLGAPRFTCAQYADDKQKIISDWKARNAQAAGKAGVDSTLAAASKACATEAAEQANYDKAVGKLQGGALAKEVAALAASRRAMTKLQSDVDRQRITYNEALQAYQTEVEAATAGQSTTDKVKDKADKAKQALDALNKIAGAFGEEIASKERLGRIDDLLASLSSGEELSSDKASKVELAISLFPGIADDLRAIRNAKKGHLAVPLLIQRDLEQAKVKAASARVAREQRAVVLHEEIVRLMVAQLIARLAALDRVTTFHDASAVKEIAAANATIKAGNTLDDVWPKLQPGPRGAVLESTALYLDSARRLELRIREARTRLNALPMDESVDLAEVNAGIWTSMIGATVDQAAEFSALGIKAEDIEKILGLIGIYYIGHGVNK